MVDVAEEGTLNGSVPQELEGFAMKKSGSVFGPRRASEVRILLAALAGWVICYSPFAATADMVVATVDDRQNADRLLIVDCLLPGQGHQLGTALTYMAPRRAISTTGSHSSIPAAVHPPHP